MRIRDWCSSYCTGVLSWKLVRTRRARGTGRSIEEKWKSTVEKVMNYEKDNIKNSISICYIWMLGSGVARAGNISLDVTASNISGVASKDPYSRKEAKGDNDQKFYIKLTSLTNGPSLNFTSYSSDHVRVSTALTYPGHPLGTTKSHNYDLVEAKRGHQYYVYASAPMNYANVHGKGNYCP